MQRPTAKYQAELRESGEDWAGVEGRMEGARGMEHITRRPQSSLTWDHGCSQKLGYQPGSMLELDLGFLHIVANV